MSTELAPSLAIDSASLFAQRDRHLWLKDPSAWVERRLKQKLWSKQREILQSVRDHRKTAVVACHGPGKSFTAAQAVAWWIGNHPIGRAAVVTTAPTDRQVRIVLWKEIRRAHSRGRLSGRTNQKQWLSPIPGGDEEIIAFGMKPSDYDPAAFQGIHGRWVLVVLDEACGIPGKTQDQPQSLWDAADSLLSNDDCRELAIGNPDDPNTRFAEICAPGSDWNVIHISAFDTPNFTGEPIPEYIAQELVGRTWVEEKRKAWAPRWRWTEDGTRCVPPEGEKIEDAHPLWVSKVLGQFPVNLSASGLIPVTWIQAAMERGLPPKGPSELGVDVGAGGDSSCVAHRLGPVVRVIHEDHNPDTMETTGNVVHLRRKTRATSVKVDKIGIGAGVTDRGREQGEPFIGINVGEAAADTENFANWRAELWWAIRERFEAGEVDLDPDDKETAAELCTLRYKRTSRGQIIIESKDEAKRRGVPSPNRAEAVMLAFAQEKKDTTPKAEVLW